MTTTDLSKAGLHCSFCHKHQAEIAKLIAGPGVYICNECVDLCDQILGEELLTTEVRTRIAGEADEPLDIAAGLDDLDDDQLIEVMVRIHRSHDGVDRTVRRVVAALRVRNVSWARIGEALGMTRQSAWERFSGEE